jgi:uncharacterized protein (DUF2249 family)
MTVELDLREQPQDSHRRELFDALDGADVGEAFEIVADRDVDPELLAYQIDRNRSLTWDHAHPDAEPRAVQLTVGETLEDGDLGSIDVRDLKPQRRHEALLQIFEDIEAGEGFVLVNDHDPKPLYHELRSMHGDVIDWEYENRGDGEWRVAIEKTGGSEGGAEDVVTRYDVRDIPKQERHPTIHHRYGMIPEGGTMELIAPHEPRPLKREFHQQYGDAFTWEIVESEPGRCRVRITKADGQGEDVGADEVVESTTVANGGDLEVVEELDVRDRPPAQRHERIYEAYGELEDGTGFVLVNDHDPKPLYHQFDAEAGPEFRWEYRQKEPGEFRVLIGKASVGKREATESKE